MKILNKMRPAISLFILLMLVAGCEQPEQQQHTSDDEVLHIHFISGSEPFDSETSLKKLKQFIEQKYAQVRITASWGEDKGDNLPNIEQLADADLMLVFTRRMVLPEDQLNYIVQHIEDEKPVIGIRPASHAFQNFLEMDARVFGGDYNGHGEDEPISLSIADNTEEHPVLKGIHLWNTSGTIYHNPDLGANTRVLINGKGLDSGLQDPLAWINIYGREGRAFYTSLGYPADFENENFIRLILNAIDWTTGM